MTDRRDFLAAMAALFAGVLLPAPVRQSIWVPAPYPQLTIAELDAAMKAIFQEPLLAIYTSPQQFIDFHRDTIKVAHYTSEPLYFDMPRQVAVG